MRSPRVWIALIAAYVVASAIHVGYVAHVEPFAFDAWNVAIDSEARPISAGRFFAFWWDQYTSSNPRLGQPLTYLAYKLEYFVAIATPLAYLALALAVTTLGLRRFPRRGRDLAFLAIALGFAWFVLPQLGRNMFCRAYAANYVYTAAFVLWFLVPLRLAATADASPPRAVLYGIAGLLVGLSNEHTGPALLVFLGGYAWWLRRRGAPHRLVVAGLAGVALGFAALFFAPGQDERYGELAQQVGLLTRLLQRGVIRNLEIVRDYVTYAAPLLALIVLVLLIGRRSRRVDDTERRRALDVLALALAAGAVITATLFVSPKLGSRFFIVPMSLLLVAFIALADAVLTRRQLVPFVLLALAASIYAGVRTLPLYREVARDGAARMAALEASRPGGELVLDAFGQVPESWWFIGDELRDLHKRELIARYFGLTRVLVRAHDLAEPLGLTGVRLVPTYRVAGDAAEHPLLTFDAGAKGFDVAGMHRATRTAIDRLRAETAGTLARFEVPVTFVGPPPPLPRGRLLLARWDGTLAAYAAKITRPGVGRTRTVILPPELPRAAEIFVVRVGDPPRALGTAAAPAQFAPWRPGVYWILACDETACFVIAAMRQRA